MRHRLAGRHLGRTSSHRVALFRNLARALITHERITTTVPKAKTLRPFIEKLITLAKNAAVIKDAGGDRASARALHLRRIAIARLGPTHGTGVYDKNDELVTENATVLKKLFNEIGPRYKDRPGGYTRILKLHTRRLGDGGEQAIIELLKAGEVRVKKERPAAAPAPIPALPPAAPVPALPPAADEPAAT